MTSSRIAAALRLSGRLGIDSAILREITWQLGSRGQFRRRTTAKSASRRTFSHPGTSPSRARVKSTMRINDGDRGDQHVIHDENGGTDGRSHYSPASTKVNQK